MQAFLSNRRRVAIILVAITAIILLLFIPYLRYRSGPALPVISQNFHAAILDPANGAQLSEHSPILVSAYAVSSQPILSLELWIDGILAGVQAAPASGQSNFTTVFLWQPPQPGDHTLVVRAIDGGKNSIYSPAVLVKITAFEIANDSTSENGGGGEVNDDAGKTYPAVLPSVPSSSTGGNGGGAESQAPQPPGPDKSVGPTSEWGALSDFIISLNISFPPNAPELVAEPQLCATKLTIHDLSDNEEGFVIYRQTPNSSAWLQVATLASQSEYEWIAYADPGTPGSLLYYVASFNSMGVSDSNLVQVNVNKDDCPPGEDAEQPILSIELASLTPDFAVERAYCYRSLGGEIWSRWPEVGFFLPNENGLHTAGNPLNIALQSLDGNMPDISLDLYLECWGWSGSELQFLGEFMIPAIDPNAPGKFMFADNGFNAEILTKLIDGITFETLDDHNIDPSMTVILPSITQDPQVCKNHLPGGLNASEQDMLCAPYPDFLVIPNFGPTQPYLVWDFGDNCLLGTGVPDPCKPYSYWLDIAPQFNAQVGFDITEYNSAGTFTYQVTSPNQFAFVIPPTSCSDQRSFTVQMWIANQNKSFRSLPSNIVTFPCSLKLFGPGDILSITAEEEDNIVGDTVFLEISFNSFVLSNVDDGGDPHVEIFGYMSVTAPSMGLAQYLDPAALQTIIDLLGPAAAGQVRFLNIAKWDQQGSNCPDDDNTIFGVDFVGDIVAQGCPQQLQSGVYSLSSDMYMCISNQKTKCNISNFGYNYNVFNVMVKEGDPLIFQVLFIDWDDLSANDTVCFIPLVFIGPRTLEQWAATSNEPFTLSSPNSGSGSCKITGVINALPQ